MIRLRNGVNGWKCPYFRERSRDVRNARPQTLRHATDISPRRDAFHRRRRQSANRENDKMNDPIAQRSQWLEVSLFRGMSSGAEKQPRSHECTPLAGFAKRAV